MIFDNDVVTKLAVEYQQTKDSAVLNCILEKSTSLVEAIVSSYDPEYREDLIQEAALKIPKAIVYYDDRFSLHTYLTTVIHNMCRTFLKKQYRTLTLYEGYDIVEEDPAEFVYDDDLMNNVICRNRTRFPSLPSDISDGMTETIVYAMRNGVAKSRGLVTTLMNEFDIPRPIATVFYHSTLVYLRAVYEGHADISNILSADHEFSLLKDLRDEIGDIAFARVVLLFSGMYIRIP